MHELSLQMFTLRAFTLYYFLLRLTVLYLICRREGIPRVAKASKLSFQTNMTFYLKTTMDLELDDLPKGKKQSFQTKYHYQLKEMNILLGYFWIFPKHSILLIMRYYCINLKIMGQRNCIGMVQKLTYEQEANSKMCLSSWMLQLLHVTYRRDRFRVPCYFLSM